MKHINKKKHKLMYNKTVRTISIYLYVDREKTVVCVWFYYASAYVLVFAYKCIDFAANKIY